MILYMDNKGKVYLVNNLSVGGRTRHIDMGQYYYLTGMLTLESCLTDFVYGVSTAQYIDANKDPV
jgi:hypothetical protein